MALFSKKILILANYMEKNKYLRSISFLFKFFTCAVFFTTILLTFLMIQSVLNKPNGDETAIVLGCRVYGERPSLSLMERLDAVYDYMMQNPNTKCIVSGGKGNGETITEAECMYRYLTNKGITKDRIFKEENSKNTRENLFFSLQIIEQNNLSPNIAIATSDYHQYRASIIANKLGIKNTAISAKTAFWLLPTYYVRELYAILYELLNLS